MEWINKFNEAIAYIEKNMEGKINLEEVARIACCSLTRFQRMFNFATDMTVGEYIRNRKMSLAANDLKNSEIKVIDLALKYGYDSPEAFTRAFQNFHGMPPTTVRKLRISTDFQPITFQIKINGGNFNIGTKPILRIEDCSNKRVISFFVNCQGPEEAAGNMLREWALKNLSDYTARRYVGYAPKGHHPEGVHHQSDEPIGSHEYLIQMFLLGDEEKNSNFHGADVGDGPQGLYLVGDVSLNEFDSNGNIDLGSSMQTAFGIMSESLKDMGNYEFDFGQRRHREEQIFSNEWWINTSIKDAGLQGFKLWLPIKKI
ncbi:helix-turn-helix transcriptional regulator [Anaerocolumna sp. MB42-C2]|uniref:helix-turn-helix transcriptional regulator n=1 Tax=Anaerocolumna sp. MB42-C2 TaxID=3070997 RepID=UPI0027DECFF0|nr:AraC family transcriptional regulator [Anaerocolumna sp. MB42-C2]WMJ87415.1 AraC family transcriptional regulator [Anaerocolumna sp. MB42-C2]